ncbi:MAG: phytanoyl-CoA dioxygenase [Chromatiales bacterium]|jgi:hypothetical protein|nr:phytanoyl-CoA dioxygenase [Chromatiales bacterium]
MSTPALKKVDYRDNEAAMQAYRRAGEQKAHALDNRGPVRYTDVGEVHPDIIAAYWKYGFYVFEGVMGADELADIEADLRVIMDALPIHKGAKVDANGRPALGVNCEAPTLFWSKPLGDPFGGTAQANGRHPVKMTEPTPATSAPEDIVYLMLGTLQFSEALLRTYGHPDLLAVAAAINGDDFVPFADALFIKEPGLGASVAWHQDGTTHWDSPNWDQGIHGFNFMGQLYGCTPANGVWVVPGSHKLGKLDIKSRVAKAGSERLPDAVPMVCAPGDFVMSNRQLLHGSFANTSEDWRVTINQGFHRRSSVEGVQGGGLHAAPAVYDATHINERSRIIGYAIDARQRRFPEEVPYHYKPFAQNKERYTWNAAAKATMHDYNLLDMSI